MDLGSLSKNESAFVIMAYALRHNLTEIGLGDLIKLANLHSPKDVHGSKYKFLKDFITPQANQIFYCSPCQKILNFIDSDKSACNKCRGEYQKKKLQHSGSYFYYLPLLPQLQRLAQSNDYRFVRRDIEKEESDVINGSVYKKLRAEGTIGNNDLSIQWNTDGVNIFNTSNSSIWPIQVAINELPYRIRNNNILLAGIWLAESKPSMNMYLRPFIDELQELNTNGFLIKPITSDHEVLIKVHTILATVDSIARPMIQNVKQFNGKFGCSMCLHPGEIAEGTVSSRVYPGSLHALRTKVYHLACVKKKFELKRKDALKGIKAASVLMLLYNFSIPEDCPADYMHAVLEGVVKLLLSLLFDSKYHHERWYLGDKENLNIIEQRLKLIKPCCEIRRNIRSIDKRKFWTAAEFKYFLLYYSLPCFLGIMEDMYLKHWFLLVHSISLLSQKYISNEDFLSAKEALFKFVNDFEFLYGKKKMRYNVHLLLHLPHNVQRFGALWAWSNFPFETFNGVLKRLFHGSQFIPDQIVKIYSRINYIKTAPNDFEKPDCNESAKLFFLSLIKNSNLQQDLVPEELSTKGLYHEKLLSDEEKFLLNYPANERGFIKSYKRFTFNRCVYHGIQSHALTKRNNSIIKTRNGSFIKIQELLRLNNGEYRVLGKKFEKLNEVLYQYDNWNSTKFCQKVTETDQLTCCLLTEIEEKCVIINCYNEDDRNKFYIFPIVNNIERD